MPCIYYFKLICLSDIVIENWFSEWYQVVQVVLNVDWTHFGIGTKYFPAGQSHFLGKCDACRDILMQLANFLTRPTTTTSRLPRQCRKRTSCHQRYFSIGSRASMIRVSPSAGPFIQHAHHCTLPLLILLWIHQRPWQTHNEQINFQTRFLDH